MVLWTFDLIWKNLWYYGKTLWYNGKKCDIISKTIEIWFTKEKNGRLQKNYEILFYNRKKNYGNIPIQLEFLNKYIALELWFTVENYDTMEKTMELWKNYGTIEKQLWNYGKNYGTMDTKKTMELWFTIEKRWNYGKKIWYCSKL